MTDALSKFIVRRRDGARLMDDLAIDGDSLLIGRLLKNDLVLNSRAVSRTHAGIKQIGRDFWIYNLSESNGTLLNGELVERTPLVGGDSIQIGPFLLKVSYAGEALMLTVESELDVQPMQGQAGMLNAPSSFQDDTASTMRVNFPAKPGEPIVTPGEARRADRHPRRHAAAAAAQEFPAEPQRARPEALLGQAQTRSRQVAGRNPAAPEKLRAIR